MGGCVLSYCRHRLYCMQSNRIFKTLSLEWTHLPTFMLVIGYGIYWIELFFFDTKNGMTSPLASVLFFLFSVVLIFLNKENFFLTIKELKSEFLDSTLTTRIYFILGCSFVFLILTCAFFASLHPPHLMQEYDVLNYHYTIPRQHLILNSFAHIPWSSADLFPLPLNFSLAPYWFVTQLPNKSPQFIFLVGEILVAARLAGRFSHNKLMSTSLVVFAIMGSHGFGIQMGTAMLDIVMCYLFLAALDSFLRGSIFLSLTEFAFLFWSKSFIPFQMVLLMLALFILFWIFKKIGFRDIQWGFNISDRQNAQVSFLKPNFFKLCLRFILLSALIGGPFVFKSLYYTGAPVFPFGTGLIKVSKNIDNGTRKWQSIVDSADSYIDKKDLYGYGRSFSDFLKHLWIIAIPEKGVNNKYDYPLGLPYLLFLGLFIYYSIISFTKKQFTILAFFIMIYWLTWWAGSHQTRFLYIPVALMFVLIAGILDKPSKILMGALVFSLMLNTLSIYRAHKTDFGISKEKILRKKDLNLFVQSKEYIQQKRQDSIDLPFGDVTFAQFPVNVNRESLPFIIAY